MHWMYAWLMSILTKIIYFLDSCRCAQDFGFSCVMDTHTPDGMPAARVEGGVGTLPYLPPEAFKKMPGAWKQMGRNCCGAILYAE